MPSNIFSFPAFRIPLFLGTFFSLPFERPLVLTMTSARWMSLWREFRCRSTCREMAPGLEGPLRCSELSDGISYARTTKELAPQI